MYQSQFRKWTNQLVEEFALKDYQKQMRSTGSSFNRTASRLDQSDSFQSYKEMPSNFKRYADSLEMKKKSYQNMDSSFQNISRMAFVEYKHYPHHDYCAKQCTLKKKVKKTCCKCKQNSKQDSRVNKIQEKAPTIIKEFHTVFVPSPPTIIREFTQPAPPPIIRPAPIIIREAPIIRQSRIMNTEIRKEVVHSRSPSNSRITFSYASPFKQPVQSLIVHPPSPKTEKQAEKIETSPYKLLDASNKIEEVPTIVVTEPIQFQQSQSCESSFSFDSKPYRDSKERKRIFPPRDSETAHFIQTQQTNTYRTNMSESFKVCEKPFGESTMMFHKFKNDPVRE